MIRCLLSMYSPRYPQTLVYMLQATEYQVAAYLTWLHRTKDFSKVMRRKRLDRTRRATTLLIIIWLGIIVQIAIGLLLVYLHFDRAVPGGAYLGAALVLLYPLLWAYAAVLPILVGRVLAVHVLDKRQIGQSAAIFAHHGSKKVAVAGSYGKTTMKELLKTVLSEGLKVAATPANKNVSISHAKFAQQLQGDEDVLIIEFGEGAPGDVDRFARLTQPTHAVITGLAPAHLDRYKTLSAAGQDIMSVTQYINSEHVYVYGDSPQLQSFIKPDYEVFDSKHALGWKVANITVELEGTGFTLTKDNQIMHLHSGLLGRHQVGYLAFAAAFAVEVCGLSPNQVERGIAKTKPFEHRMQPYQLNKAWVIDDTYNGNLEGIRAGTALLAELPARRKIYVTPGLVDQGESSADIHAQVGSLIAEAKPDIVVLMQNSATQHINNGLTAKGFTGKILIEKDPLEFYTNLNHFVAGGDLVLMQNDWTDNYA